MITSLPSDCLDVILAFLPLKSVVVLGSSSRNFLLDIQPDIQRRSCCFTETYCYLASPTETIGRASSPFNKARTYASVRRDSSSDDVSIRLLPTVRDRVDSLWRSIPASHPCTSQVKDLKDAISNIRNGHAEEALNAKGANTPEERLNVESLMQAHTSNIKCHKLHAIILDRVTRSDPIVSRGEDASILTVGLDQYIGDILCNFYLMGHSAAGIVEASPDESAWVDSVYRDLGIAPHEISDHATAPAIVLDHPVNNSAWYRVWVFVHSSVLRVAPFTWDHQIRLGIASPMPSSSSSPASIDVARGSLLRPHAPFAGFSKVALMRTLSRITCFSPMRVKFNNFGPLGPSFRGRDSIQSITCYSVSVIGTAICFEVLSPEEYNRPGTVASNFRPFLRNWVFEHDSVIQFLLQLHEQSRKTRPMTVVPPFITLGDFN